MNESPPQHTYAHELCTYTLTNSELSVSFVGLPTRAPKDLHLVFPQLILQLFLSPAAIPLLR